MNILTANQVKSTIETNPDTKLVMTLGPKAYAKGHIPGSLNIYDIEMAKQTLPIQCEIIVYCSDKMCMASYYAYQQLEQAGFKKIWRFAGGLVEWSEAGYVIEKS